MTSGKPDTLLICPLTAADVSQMRSDMASAAQRGAGAVECRLDYLSTPPGDEDLRQLLKDPPLRVIVTCRPRREGGRFEGSEYDRLGLLCKAANLGADFIDVELDVPVADRPETSHDRPEVILSHHDFETAGADLDAIVAAEEASMAAVNKVVVTAAAPEDALRMLDVVRASAKPAIALAMGEPGLPSRILAKKVGAFGTFASLASGAESAPGQPTLEDMCGLYRWDDVSDTTSVYGVIGCPIAHSMSPAVHNAAFAAAGVDGVYVPLLIQPDTESFHRFMDAVLTRPWLDWRGLSVTIPHKENALAYVGAENCDPLAVTIGAVNTITIDPDGSLRGDNTDYAAAIDALCNAMDISRQDLAGRPVAVLGAGGVARAIVAALAHYQAETTLYNRTVSRGQALAEEFGCRAFGREALVKMDAEIVINCTSIGMHPNVDAAPLEAIPPSVKVVFDTVYNPIQTRLLRSAQSAGCVTVSGLDMFVNQAVAQFEIWTGASAPREVMRDVVVQRLSAGNLGQ